MATDFISRLKRRGGKEGVEGKSSIVSVDFFSWGGEVVVAGVAKHVTETTSWMDQGCSMNLMIEADLVICGSLTFICC